MTRAEKEWCNTELLERLQKNPLIAKRLGGLNGNNWEIMASDVCCCFWLFVVAAETVWVVCVMLLLRAVLQTTWNDNRDLLSSFVPTDPQFTQAINEFQTNPQAAQQKYAGNPEVNVVHAYLHRWGIISCAAWHDGFNFDPNNIGTTFRVSGFLCGCKMLRKHMSRAGRLDAEILKYY